MTMVVFARGDGGHVLVTEFQRYGTKLSVLCWCATATRSWPPHWLYLQTPPWLGRRTKVDVDL